MARLIQGILGGISGKIGNVVGSSWKGIAIIKSKPLSVANPRTSGQIAQRTKMKNVVSFSVDILATIIKPLWDRFSQQASGYNEFVSKNIDLFTTEMPSNPSELIISKGKMSAVTPVITTIDEFDTSVTITFPTSLPDSLSLANDFVYAVVVQEVAGVVNSSGGLVTRSTGTITVPVSIEIDAAQNVNVYLAFRRSDGTVVSGTGFATQAIS